MACSPPQGGEDPVRTPGAEAGGAPRWTTLDPGPEPFDALVVEARRRAAHPFEAVPQIPDPQVAGLPYGRMRGIRFRPEAAIGHGEAPFELQFFHAGGAFSTPVGIHQIDGEEIRTLPFDPDAWTYGAELAGMEEALARSGGFAGFRVLSRMNDPGRLDEVIAVQGASYFRLVGPGQVYGLSSRGIAVRTAGMNGEEFPVFREFWIHRSTPTDSTLLFLALLDGPSIAGAYRFELQPGIPAPASGTPRGTVLSVEARLFARAPIDRIGFAPLTSMFLHGAILPPPHEDLRPRVHDSEGLLVRSGSGEWIWRPLTNGRGVRVTSLRDSAPGGFGLVQRTRDFDGYLDLEAEYHRRPSQWVEVEGGDWGPGGVELVELPTPGEFEDNIVAYWAPDGGMAAGEERSLRYRLVTFDDRLLLPGGDGFRSDPGGATHSAEPLARAIRSRIAPEGLPGQAEGRPPFHRRVLIDFEGGPLPALAVDAPVEAAASTSAGSIHDLRVQLLPGGGRRVTFVVAPGPDDPPGAALLADLRILLADPDGHPLSESWSYLLEIDR